MTLMHVRKVWDDYFTPETKEFETTQTLSGTSVHVSNCLFNSITSTNNGGALYCTSVANLLIESSSFFCCNTNDQQGGAIYFLNNNGQCVLHGICGYDCCSTNTSDSSNSQFAYIEVKNAASSKNYVNYSSIVQCMNEKSNSHHTLGLSRGRICCTSVNMSMNKCQHYSGISCWPLMNPNLFTCSLTFSTFTDNIANGHNCIWLNTKGAKFEIKSCNILRNTEVSSAFGTIFTSGDLMIMDSCILENNATYIFYQGYSYTTTLSNCTVDKITNNQNLVTQNAVTKSFILALNHMSTRNCHSEYDSVAYLTPITPHMTSSKKKIYCNTNGNSFCQSQLRYLVSLISFSFLLAPTN
jgi:predicted outer membrane repeat protein